MATRLLALSIAVALVTAACGGPAATQTAGQTAGQTASSPTTTQPALQAGTGSLPSEPGGPVERATVIRIVDGDTIVVDRGRGNEKVRYIGIDTPESVKPATPVEFMGKEASAENASLVEGRTVLLEKDVSETDQYDRLLRYVWVEDPSQPHGLLLVNLALVAHGFAQVATFPPDVRYTDLFRAAERIARDQGLGLWGPVAPAP